MLPPYSSLAFPGNPEVFRPRVQQAQVLWPSLPDLPCCGLMILFEPLTTSRPSVLTYGALNIFSDRLARASSATSFSSCGVSNFTYGITCVNSSPKSVDTLMKAAVLQNTVFSSSLGSPHEVCPPVFFCVVAPGPHLVLAVWRRRAKSIPCR